MTAARVAVTTTPDRYPRHAAVLEDLALSPVMLPCIEIVAAAEDILTTAREEASRADWLVVTSARVVDVLWSDGSMPSAPVAAVGPVTATAVAAAGGNPEVVGSGGAIQLARELGDVVAGRAVFLPQSSGADPGTASALRRAGASVTTAEVYEVRPSPPGNGRVDAVMFGSPSAVDGWLLCRDLDGLLVGAIGHTTAAAISRQGRRPDVIPPEPSFDRLARLMADRLKDRSST